VLVGDGYYQSLALNVVVYKVPQVFQGFFGNVNKIKVSF
jgi:hypothetical protein